MDLSGLTQWLASKIGTSQPGVVVGPDGTKYGPAQTRISRTPVAVSTDAPHQGQYDPATQSITVNPTIQNQSMHDTMVHEQMHAIMDKLGSGYAQASTNSPSYATIASAIGQNSGDPAREAPAWSATGDMYGVPTAVRQSYMQDVYNNIMKLGRGDIASMFKKDAQ